MPTLVMATHHSATFVDVNGAQIEFDFRPEDNAGGLVSREMI